MSEPGPANKKTSTRRLLLAIPLLLVVAVAVNFKDVSALARGEKSLKGIIYGLGGDGEPALTGWKMPAPSGPEDAKVTIEVLLREGDGCHIDMLCMGQALATLDPARIRTIFVNTGTGTGTKRFKDLKLGCEQGLAVNGKTKFRAEKADGKEKTYYLTLDGGWERSDLIKLIDSELKKAHKGKGLTLTVAQAQEQIESESARARELMNAEAKSRQNAKKGK